MNSDLNNYFSTINKLINKQNGKQIAKELDLKKALLSNSSFVKNIKNNIKTIDGIIALSNNNLNNCLTNVISQFLASFLALSFNNYEDSFKYSQLSYNSLMTYFGSGNSENSSTWVIPIISKLSNNLRFVSFEGDNKGINSHLKYSNEAIDTLTRGFAIAVKDRTSINESYSRRLALFSMANILFKYYFQFHKLHLCEKLIQVIEGYKNVPPLVDMKNTSLKLFNVVDIITYKVSILYLLYFLILFLLILFFILKYYAGKLKLYNDAFVESREFLTFVLKNLPLNCISNRQKVLVILIPLQMIVGIMPTEKISIVYGLHELYGLSKAIKTGIYFNLL